MEDVKLVGFISSPLQALNLVEYSNLVSRQVDLVVGGRFSVLEPVSRTQIAAGLAPAIPRHIIRSCWLLSIRKVEYSHSFSPAQGSLTVNVLDHARK
jgi:hypothetical protein